MDINDAPNLTAVSPALALIGLHRNRPALAASRRGMTSARSLARSLARSRDKAYPDVAPKCDGSSDKRRAVSRLLSSPLLARV